MSATGPNYYPPLDGKAPKEVSDAIKVAYDKIYATQAQVSAIVSAVQSVQATQAQQVSDTEQASEQSLAALNSVGTLTGGSSGPLQSQASTLPTIIGAFAYVSTTTTITWYWDGTNGSSLLTVYWPNGQQTPIPPGHLEITGLTAGTAYTFYPYAPSTSPFIEFVSTSNGVGTPAVAYTNPAPSDLAQASLDGVISMPTLSASTTSTGTGGGSSGGGRTKGTNTD